MANDRTQAQDAASWYFSHLDPFSPNHDNIRRFLRGPLLAVTIKALYCTTLDPAGGGGAPEEEKKASESWREYLDPILAEETFGFNEKGQSAYDSLSRRTKARMEAFLAGCTLAVPGNVPDDNNDKSTVFRKKGDNMVSLQDGLSGFGISKVSSRILSPKAKPKVPTTPPRVSLAEQGKTLMRKISRPDSIHPQIPEEDLVIRLELYIRTMQRVRTLKEECVVPMEPPKFIKLRARYITRAFVVTAGCVRSMSPVLTRLLNCITMELLAVETLSEEHITKVIRRLVSEYEHGTSFASLAFLSTPEVNADSLLTPIVIKYLRYLQKDWETLVRECELERVLSRALDPTMRNMFKKIEFRSIGHLLEVCHENRSKLQNIELAPNVCAVAENINNLCSDKEALRQALRDLQREVIMVNGHILPPVTSRKELLHLLTQTLNSRTLTADRPRSAKKSKRKVHRAQTYPSTIPTAAETSEDDPALAVAKDGDFLFSSSEMDSSEVDEDVGMKSPSRKNGNRHNFHLSTIDLLTRRLLIAASRTGNGGDAYFVVRDLFGGEDVEAVPSNTLPMQDRMVRPGTIDILVRLASVTIKCHQSFDIYPRTLVGECEPLIQFHTTTTETINLQEIRTADSQDNFFTKDGEYAHGEAPGSPKMKSLLVVQEQMTTKTGWRTISVRPALYEKVEVWSTPS